MNDTSDENMIVPEAGTASETPPKKSGKAKRIFPLILLGALGFAGYEGYSWWTDGRFIEKTDDAYVTVDITTVLSKVSGYVAAIEAEDNQVIAKDDVILKIEAEDYRLAVRAAQDRLRSVKATVERIVQQAQAGQAAVHQAQAGIKVAEAAREDATLNYKRQQKLIGSNVASQASLDTARTRQMKAQANLDKATAALEQAKANITVLKSQKIEAEQSVKSAETALVKAKRDLSFTTIRAPISGVLSNRAAQVGSLLQAGSRVAAIVPLSEAHIIANLKETQLTHLKSGAHVSIKVDAYPDAHLTGKVDSLSPATGSVFSLLPPENATGNFTKVVQRIPVKITLPPEQLNETPLRAGMSVVVEIDTRTGSGALDRLSSQ